MNFVNLFYFNLISVWNDTLCHFKRSIKSGIENGIEVILKLLSNDVGDSNDENNFPHKFLLTNTQVSKLRKAFADDSSSNIN